MTTSTDMTAVQGQKIFHCIWQHIQTFFYDQERLLAIDWISQKHRYDEVIVDKKSALSYAEILLASLGDKYTRLLTETEVQDKATRRDNDELYAYSNVFQGNIGYIGISSFDHHDIAEQVRERLDGIKDCAAFIVDVRGNGGGLLDETANVVELFVESGAICSIERRSVKGLFKSSVRFSPGRYELTKTEAGRQTELEFYRRLEPLISGKPMVVLIDRDTASSAEMFTGALLDNGRPSGQIVAMGSRTGAKGIGQADFDILGQVTLKISLIRFMSPNGNWFGDAAQTIDNGIEPDYCLSLAKDVEDPVLVATNYLQNKLKLAAVAPRQVSRAA